MRHLLTLLITPAFVACTAPSAQEEAIHLGQDQLAVVMTSAAQMDTAGVDVKLSSASTTLPEGKQYQVLSALLEQIKFECQATVNPDKLAIAAEVIRSFESPEGMELSYFSVNPGYLVPVARSTKRGSISETVEYLSFDLPEAARNNETRPSFKSLEDSQLIHAVASSVTFQSREPQLAWQVSYRFEQFVREGEPRLDLTDFGGSKRHDPIMGKFVSKLVASRAKSAAEIERIFIEFPRPEGLRLSHLKVTRLLSDGKGLADQSVLSSFGQ